jgi:AraC family transcriptional activator of pobA
MKTEYNGRLVARNLTLQSLLGMVVSMLLRYRDRDQQSESKWGVEHPGQRYYRQFQNQIGQKLSARVSIADHAARLRISTTHLNRVCRDLAGKSALDVVHDRIITEAKRSLTYTVLPVASIAYQLGFNDPSYFSRFFKTKTGYSPRQYQHQVRLQV